MQEILAEVFKDFPALITEIAKYIRSDFRQELPETSLEFWSFPIINKHKLKKFKISLGQESEQ